MPICRKLSLEAQHICECHCGYISITNPHDITYSYYNPTQHYEDCSECTYAGAVTHEYIVPCSPAETGHSLKCACGTENWKTEAHYAYRYTSNDGNHHNVYCECGYLIGRDLHAFRTTALGIRRCYQCGYVHIGNPGGDNVIMGEEDEPTESE